MGRADGSALPDDDNEDAEDDAATDAETAAEAAADDNDDDAPATLADEPAADDEPEPVAAAETCALEPAAEEEDALWLLEPCTMVNEDTPPVELLWVVLFSDVEGDVQAAENTRTTRAGRFMVAHPASRVASTPCKTGPDPAVCVIGRLSLYCGLPMITTVRCLVAVWMVFAAACATTGHGGRPTHVEISVTGVDEAMSKEVASELSANAAFKNVKLRSLNAGVAIYDADFSGDAASLQDALAAMKKPSLSQPRVSVHAFANAADTEAPPAVILFPHKDDVLLKKKVSVVAQVTGADVKEVLINGVVTKPFRGVLYRQQVDLIEGPNEIALAAVDLRGNRTVQKFKVTVDTTPITMSQHDPVAVGGSGSLEETFLVDGNPATIFTTQSWRVETTVPKGQTQVEVIKMDSTGQVSVIKLPTQR